MTVLKCPHLLDGPGGKETRLCNWGRDDLGMTEAGEPIWHDQLAQMNAHLIVRHNDWRLIENIRAERKSRNCRTHTELSSSRGITKRNAR